MSWSHGGLASSTTSACRESSFGSGCAKDRCRRRSGKPGPSLRRSPSFWATRRMTSNLAARSREFAGEVAELLSNTIGCTHPIVSEKAPAGEKYVVRPDQPSGKRACVPLFVDREHLADLEIAMFQVLDRSGRYLKTSKTNFRIFSTIDRTPLLRLEYDSEASVAPAAHWQFHAERGAFAHLLTIASRTRNVRGPGDLSKLHLPVGGERFRPGLEDVLEFLIRDCGIDCVEGWEDVIKAGRRRWRIRQLRSAVRDQQDEVVGLLRELGWTVTRGDAGPAMHDTPFTRW